jgi:hypothetical protein
MKKTQYFVHFFEGLLFSGRRFRSLLSSLFIAMLILSGTLTGCATVELSKEGRKIEEKNIKKIMPGNTTREEIVEIFGEPKEIIEKAAGREELFFEHKVNEAPTYLGGVVIDKKRAREQKYTLMVIIKDNIVESYRYEMKEEK